MEHGNFKVQKWTDNLIEKSNKAVRKEFMGKMEDKGK